MQHSQHQSVLQLSSISDYMAAAMYPVWAAASRVVYVTAERAQEKVGVAGQAASQWTSHGKAAFGKVMTVYFAFIVNLCRSIVFFFNRGVLHVKDAAGVTVSAAGGYVATAGRAAVGAANSALARIIESRLTMARANLGKGYLWLKSQGNSLVLYLSNRALTKVGVLRDRALANLSRNLGEFNARFNVIKSMMVQHIVRFVNTDYLGRAIDRICNWTRSAAEILIITGKMGTENVAKDGARLPKLYLSMDIPTVLAYIVSKLPQRAVYNLSLFTSEHIIAFTRNQFSQRFVERLSATVPELFEPLTDTNMPHLASFGLLFTIGAILTAWISTYILVQTMKLASVGIAHCYNRVIVPQAEKLKAWIIKKKVERGRRHNKAKRSEVVHEAPRNRSSYRNESGDEADDNEYDQTEIDIDDVARNFGNVTIEGNTLSIIHPHGIDGFDESSIARLSITDDAEESKMECDDIITISDDEGNDRMDGVDVSMASMRSAMLSPNYNGGVADKMEISREPSENDIISNLALNTGSMALDDNSNEYSGERTPPVSHTSRKGSPAVFGRMSSSSMSRASLHDSGIKMQVTKEHTPDLTPSRDPNGSIENQSMMSSGYDNDSPSIRPSMTSTKHKTSSPLANRSNIYHSQDSLRQNAMSPSQKSVISQGSDWTMSNT